jgi:proteic killer suppression protein
VIVSFGDRATEALYDCEPGKATRAIPVQIHAAARRKLDCLNEAAVLSDLRAPPGNRLEALRGGLRGHHSIRVNDRWRIVFRWTPFGPRDVRVTDYR